MFYMVQMLLNSTFLTLICSLPLELLHKLNFIKSLKERFWLP